MRYAVVIEQAGNNYSAYVPDLPGCVATGATTVEVEGLIHDAIELHLAGMREDWGGGSAAVELGAVVDVAAR
ncbi:type II toxin-antitoxin system HicB family antitoxin [Xanthomonas translucens]|uniref:type II toxin-antitoxin system HicB family antitoxin n=1 Tax=Xanthomonas campestris pv. translucens TaxID=343 RepID=UPI00071E8D7C|nr:type II toxin-antitoxin system HicB family antitoxin [Xanthomonas translucens]